MHRTALRALIVATALACVACGKRSNEVVKPFHPIPGQPDETPLWKEKQINRDRIESEQAPSMVFWLWLLPVGGSIAWAALWEQLHRRRARAEKRTVEGGSLRNGSAVIQGVVETDGGDAITVVVTQKKKTFKDKQGRVHISWHESKRKVIARPFRVVLPDQQAVRVEPDSRVHLRDKVEAPTLVDGDYRERRVRLQPRERVWVTGRLSGQASPGGGSAYREAPPTAVLRPERFRRMIVSTESPGAYFLERADMYRLWKKGFLIAALVAHGTVFLDYTLLVLSGRPETAQIAAYKSWQEWVKPKNQAGRWVTHFAVDAQGTPEGERKEFEVNREFHRCVERGGCQTIPTSKAWLTLGALQRPGRGPTLHIVQLVIPGVIGWVVALIFLYVVRSSRPWYAGGKIDDGA